MPLTPFAIKTFEFVNCASCNRNCNLHHFIQNLTSKISLENVRHKQHTLNVTRLAAEIVQTLYKRNLIGFRESCETIIGAFLHDFGKTPHLLYEIENNHIAEVRHSYLLEYWLRCNQQDHLAAIVRHSAPQMALDIWCGSAELPQLIIAYCDSRTCANGEIVPLQSRFNEINQRHGNKPSWNLTMQHYYEYILKHFEKWLHSSPLALFGGCGKYRKRDITFVERCDGRYASPCSALWHSNTISHLLLSSIARQWKCDVVTNHFEENLSDNIFDNVSFYFVDSLIKCINLIQNQQSNYKMICSSWLSLFEHEDLPKTCARVLVIRGLRQHRITPRFMARIQNALECGKLNKVVVVSNTLAKLLSEYGVESMIIPNGVNRNIFRPYLGPREPMILFSGAPIYEKGIDIFLKAAEKLETLGIKAVVAGTTKMYGYDHPHVPKTEHSNIDWRGFLTQEELASVMSHSLAVVIPTRPEELYEGFSKAAIESLSVGTPIIVSSSGHLPFWVDNRATGWVMPNNDPIELANIIEDNLERLLSGTLAPYCIEAVKNYSWERTAWEFDLLYDEIQQRKLELSLTSAQPVQDRYFDYLKQTRPELASHIVIGGDDRKNSHSSYTRKNRDNKGWILAIEPHPDDIAYSCALELLKLQEKGYEIEVLSLFTFTPIATFSDAGRFYITEEEYHKVRKYENLNALQDLCGFNVLSMDIPSATLRYYASLTQAPDRNDPAFSKLGVIMSTYAAKNPYKVFVPAGFGGHPDHLVTRSAALEIFNINLIIFYEDVPYHDDEHTLKYLKQLDLIPISGTDFNVDGDNKVKIISQYISQLPVTSRKGIYDYVKNFCKRGGNSLENFWAREVNI